MNARYVSSGPGSRCGVGGGGSAVMKAAAAAAPTSSPASALTNLPVGGRDSSAEGSYGDGRGEARGSGDEFRTTGNDLIGAR